MRLIDADKLVRDIKLAERSMVEHPPGMFAMSTQAAIDAINIQRTVDAEPVVHAHWKVSYEEAGVFETTRTYYFGHCSKCGRKIDIVCLSGLHSTEGLEEAKRKAHEDYPYCHCGAKMDEEADNEED